jgi:hypothetical protein
MESVDFGVSLTASADEVLRTYAEIMTANRDLTLTQPAPRVLPPSRTTRADHGGCGGYCGADVSRSSSNGTSARNAAPRWLIASFSAGDISALVRCSPVGTKIGS